MHLSARSQDPLRPPTTWKLLTERCKQDILSKCCKSYHINNRGCTHRTRYLFISPNFLQDHENTSDVIIDSEERSKNDVEISKWPLAAIRYSSDKVMCTARICPSNLTATCRSKVLDTRAPGAFVLEHGPLKHAPHQFGGVALHKNENLLTRWLCVTRLRVIAYSDVRN
jgi:hypothetical protein